MTQYEVADTAKLTVRHHVFVARTAFKADTLALNSVLAQAVAGCVSVKASGTSMLTLSTDRGGFHVASPSATLSDKGKTVTVTGSFAQINEALKSISLTASASLKGRALKSNLAGTVSLSLASGGSRVTSSLQICVEKPASSLFALGGKEYALVNGISSLTASSFAKSGYTAKSVIDAEKSGTGARGDDNLCWAGVAANMLAWTGYGQEGLASKGIPATEAGDLEDMLFKQFWSSCEDEGGFASDGIRWFAGESDGVELKSSAMEEGFLDAMPKAFSWKRRNAGTVAKSMQTVAVAVVAGDAVGLSIYDSDGGSGHAITCWGVSFDAACEPNDPRWLTGCTLRILTTTARKPPQATGCATSRLPGKACRQATG